MSLKNLWYWRLVWLYFSYTNAWHMGFQYLVIQFLLNILYFVVKNLNMSGISLSIIGVAVVFRLWFVG